MKRYCKRSLAIILFLISCVGCFAQPSVVDVRDFGAKGNGRTDDSRAIEKAFDFVRSQQQKERNVTLRFPKGEYPISVQYKISNVLLTGEGKLIPVSGKNDFVLSLTGDGNKVSGLTFFEASFCRSLLILTGDNNLVEDCVFDNVRKSQSNKVVYSDRLLSLDKNTGKGNVVRNCVFNNGRVGVALSGSYKLLNSTISNCVMGVLASPSSTNSEISGNTIKNNNVTHKSGADGILAQRNVRNLHIHHNKILNSGEHGIYFQGDNSVIEHNEVYNNYLSGIKLASYNTQLYSRGEKGYYIGNSNIIRNNKVYNNCVAAKSTAAGIYLQAPLTDITVEGNVVYGNYNGIRSTSVAKLKPNEYKTRAVLTNLSFTNNEVYNNRGYSLNIEGETGVRIIGNTVDNVMTTSKSPTHKIVAPVIRKNMIRKDLVLNRAEKSRIEENEIGRYRVNSNSKSGKHSLSGNKIKASN